MPTITRNDTNTGSTGGCCGNSSSPCSTPSPLCVRIKLAARGISTAKASAPCVLVGNAEQRQGRTGLRLPDAFDRRDLRGLMLERVEPVQVAEQDLQRREHRAEQTPVLQHDARCRGRRTLRSMRDALMPASRNAVVNSEADQSCARAGTGTTG